MLKDTPTLAQLLKTLQNVPYLASKNIYRVASYFLHQDQRQIEQFCAVLLKAKQNISQCEHCFCWKEKGYSCAFCSAKDRNQKIICVVESWQELLSIEKTGGYQGVFHVLGGVICPLEGIGPENLTIEQLVKRVAKNNIDEVILATNQTPEGEATATFIVRSLKKLEINIKISCLARGIPVGSTLESMDRVTVYKALSERRPF